MEYTEERAAIERLAARVARLDRRVDNLRRRAAPTDGPEGVQRRTRLLDALRAEANSQGMALAHRVRNRSGLSQSDFDRALDELARMDVAVRWNNSYVMLLQ